MSAYIQFRIAFCESIEGKLYALNMESESALVVVKNSVLSQEPCSWSMQTARMIPGLEDFEPTQDLIIAIDCEIMYRLSTGQSRFSQLS